MARKKKRYLDMEARWKRAIRRNMVSARPGIHKCILVLDHLKPDFNIGKLFRSGDAFGVREIHLVGVDLFDPEPAKGSVRWVPCISHSDFAACHQVLTRRGYTLFTLEPDQGALLCDVLLPQHSAFILGHEEFGISFDRRQYPDIQSLSIPQWGQVQSLNVSVAGSIVLYEYVRQHGVFSARKTHPPAGRTGTKRHD